MLQQKSVKATAVTKLHDEIEDAARRSTFRRRHDVGVHEFAADFDLAQELHPIRLADGDLRQHHFDCDLISAFAMARLVNDSHSAPADEFLDFISSDLW